MVTSESCIMALLLNGMIALSAAKRSKKNIINIQGNIGSKNSKIEELTLSIPCRTPCSTPCEMVSTDLTAALLTSSITAGEKKCRSTYPTTATSTITMIICICLPFSLCGGLALSLSPVNSIFLFALNTNQGSNLIDWETDVRLVSFATNQQVTVLTHLAVNHN